MNHDLFAVRCATPDDLDALHALDHWPSREVWLEKIARREVWVLVDPDDAVRGLMRFAVLWTTVPFLGLIVIQKEYRGRGLSRQMLDGLCAELRRRGFVALLSSSQTNEPEPQAWHVRMGFRSNGLIEHIDDENIGELVYRLVL